MNLASVQSMYKPPKPIPSTYGNISQARIKELEARRDEILNILETGEMYMVDIGKALNISQGTAIIDIRALKLQGKITTRKECYKNPSKHNAIRLVVKLA